MPKHLTIEDTEDFLTAAQVGSPGGVAQLGADGKVPDDQLPTVLTGSVDSVNGQIGNVTLTADSVSAVAKAEKGAPNGVAPLDSTGRLPAAHLPSVAVQTSVLGAPNGVATLDENGRLSATQTPIPPVSSVNGESGDVLLEAADVGAIPASQKGAASGVATLDGSGRVPQSQIPSLADVYLPIPATTPEKPGLRLVSVAGGSNSVQWAEPLVYSASSAAAMPTGVPLGSLCTRTDTRALFEWNGSSWVTLVPGQTAWQEITLPSGYRGYGGNSVSWRPRIRAIGNQVFLKGRVESSNGANIPSGFTINLPAQFAPSTTMEIPGTSTTSNSQIGWARWQLNSDGSLIFFGNSEAGPFSSWLGFSATWLTD